MKLYGLQQTTLLDYPGHVAATVFTGGCNFRCPFCHNSDLLEEGSAAFCSQQEALAFLKKRAPLLDGVCITGGEPTLQPDLEDFIREVRKLGLLIKLDTNGYRPGVLKRLCSQGLLDYVAMDIKAGRENYGSAAGIPGLIMAPVLESVRFLLENSVDYEFRTTVVKEIHSDLDFLDIAQWIRGCPSYYLQNFQESEQVLSPGFSPAAKAELLHFASLVRDSVGQVALRGIDY